MSNSITRNHRTVKQKTIRNPNTHSHGPLELNKNYTEIDYITRDMHKRIHKLDTGLKHIIHNSITQQRKKEQEMHNFKEELNRPNMIAWQKPINYATPQRNSHTKKRKAVSSPLNSPLNIPVIPLPPIKNNAQSKKILNELLGKLSEFRTSIGLSPISE